MISNPSLVEDYTPTKHEYEQLTTDHVFLRNDAPDTSIAAAKKVLGRTGSQRRRVYNYILSNGIDGATDQQIQDALSISESSERPRRKELLEAGLIIDSGERRPTRSGNASKVWIALVRHDL